MENLAVFLILLGVLLIFGFGVYHLLYALLYVAEIPMVIKVGIVLIIGGFVLVVLKLIWEKLQGGDDSVNRKY